MSVTNEFKLIARITIKPELKKTRSQMSVCELKVAEDTDKKGEDGKRVNNYFTVTAFGKTAETIVRHNGVGDLLAIVGELKPQSWVTDRGEKRYSLQMVVDRYRTLDWRSKKESNRENEAVANLPETDFPEGDDLPF